MIQIKYYILFCAGVQQPTHDIEEPSNNVNRIGVKLSAAVIYSSKIMFMLVKVKVKVNF